MIAQSIESLLRQDYPGPFRVVLVDDGSDDGTAAVALAAAAALGGAERLEVLRGNGAAAGMDRQAVGSAAGRRARHGLRRGDRLSPADRRRHRPCARQSSSARRARRARGHGAGLADGATVVPAWAERFLIPAFVFFFQMLYPFAWVAQRQRKLAAAAGGCMLVRRDALERAGGIAAIRSEIIDDCALARRLKAAGADLARPDAARPEPAALWRIPGDRPDGLALGLCAARLLAAAACGHRRRHGADLSDGRRCSRFSAAAWRRRRGCAPGC